MSNLPHNLQVREAEVLAVYPGMAIGTIGDAAHQAEHSDHDEDARGLVHAEDFMTQAYEQAHRLPAGSAAAALLAWFAAWHADAEYWIHDRLIYERAHNFAPRPYAGADPHINHVHFSGKHGSTGEDAETGTGYDTAAEAMTPPPLEDDMELTDRIDTIAPPASTPGAPVTVGQALRMIYYRSGVLAPGLPQPPTVAQIVAAAVPALVAALPAGKTVDDLSQADLDAIEARVHAEVSKLHLDVTA